MAAFFLSCAAVLLRRSSLATSAYHDLVVAFIFFFPSVFIGIVDWQRYFHGAWLQPIQMKLQLAPLLLLLLAVGVFIGYRQGAYYYLSALTVDSSWLGYFGGQLSFGGRSPTATVQFAAGQKLYEANCSGCHPHGGNALMSNLPLRAAPQLKDRDNFIGFLRHPQLPNGGKGIMPAFNQDELSDQDAAKLYGYIQHYIAHPESSGRAP